MIRSLGSAEAQWRIVPSGFRIAWNGVDPSMFDLPSWWSRLLTRPRVALGKMRVEALTVVRGLGRTAEMIADLAQTGRAALAVAALMAADAVRRGARRARSQMLAAHRVIRLPGSRHDSGQWNVVIALHVHARDEQRSARTFGRDIRIAAPAGA